MGKHKRLRQTLEMVAQNMEVCESAMHFCGNGRIVRFDSWRCEANELEPNEALDYGSLRDLKEYETPQPTDYFMLPYMTGSDYAGDSVTVANHKVFLEMYGKFPGVHNVYGGHGTYAVVVRLNVIHCLKHDGKTLYDVLEGLANYPLIDEDAHSEIELEAEAEAWTSWAADDFKRELQKIYPQYDEAIDEFADGDDYQQFFEDAREAANEYWENETGNSMYIRLENIAAKVTEDQLKAALGIEATPDQQALAL